MKREKQEDPHVLRAWNTVRDVARYFRFSERKVYRLMKHGKIQANREGGNTRISRAAVLEYEWHLKNQR